MELIDFALQHAGQFIVVGGVIGASWFLYHIMPKDLRTGLMKYKNMPTMKPLPIPTKGKGFWGGNAMLEIK